jgi:hypothetical protein
MTNSTPATAADAAGNAQGNEGKAANAGANQGAPKAEPMIIDRQGKQIAVPPEKVKDLVSKGLDYEINNAALKRDSQQYREFEEFRTQVRNSPALGQVLEQAMRDPNAALQKLTTQPSDNKDDNDGEEPKKQAKQQVQSSANSDLERRLQALEEDRSRSVVSSAMSKEIQTYPWVAESEKATRFVNDHVTARLEAGSREPLAVLVGEAANAVREVLVESQAKALERNERSQKMKTGGDRQGGPMLTPAPKFTEKDIASGKVRDFALQRAREWGLTD